MLRLTLQGRLIHETTVKPRFKATLLRFAKVEFYVHKKNEFIYGAIILWAKRPSVAYLEGRLK